MIIFDYILIWQSCCLCCYSLIIASKYNPIPILQNVLPWMPPSKSVVVFCQFIEVWVDNDGGGCGNGYWDDSWCTVTIMMMMVFFAVFVMMIMMVIMIMMMVMVNIININIKVVMEKALDI